MADVSLDTLKQCLTANIALCEQRAIEINQAVSKVFATSAPYYFSGKRYQVVDRKQAFEHLITELPNAAIDHPSEEACLSTFQTLKNNLADILKPFKQLDDTDKAFFAHIIDCHAGLARTRFRHQAVLQSIHAIHSFTTTPAFLSDVKQPLKQCITLNVRINELKQELTELDDTIQTSIHRHLNDAFDTTIASLIHSLQEDKKRIDHLQALQAQLLQQRESLLKSDNHAAIEAYHTAFGDYQRQLFSVEESFKNTHDRINACFIKQRKAITSISATQNVRETVLMNIEQAIKHYHAHCDLAQTHLRQGQQSLPISQQKIMHITNPTDAIYATTVPTRSAMFSTLANGNSGDFKQLAQQLEKKMAITLPSIHELEMVDIQCDVLQKTIRATLANCPSHPVTHDYGLAAYQRHYQEQENKIARHLHPIHENMARLKAIKPLPMAASTPPVNAKHTVKHSTHHEKKPSFFRRHWKALLVGSAVGMLLGIGIAALSIATLGIAPAIAIGVTVASAAIGAALGAPLGVAVCTTLPQKDSSVTAATKQQRRKSTYCELKSILSRGKNIRAEPSQTNPSHQPPTASSTVNPLIHRHQHRVERLLAWYKKHNLGWSTNNPSHSGKIVAEELNKLTLFNNKLRSLPNHQRLNFNDAELAPGLAVLLKYENTDQRYRNYLQHSARQPSH